MKTIFFSYENKFEICSLSWQCRSKLTRFLVKASSSVTDGACGDERRAPLETGPIFFNLLLTPFAAITKYGSFLRDPYFIFKLRLFVKRKCKKKMRRRQES